MSGIIHRFTTLPRAVQWAIWGLALLAAYFLAVEPGLEYKERLDARAEQAADAVGAFHEAGGDRDDRRSRVAAGASRYGEVLLPAGMDKSTEGAMAAAAAQRVQEFNGAITRVLDKHKVARRESSPDTHARLPAGPLASLVGADRDVARMVREIVFTASPETVTDILSELESTKEVSSISRVLIVRPDPTRDGASRELTVTITAETWVVRPKGARS